MEVNALQVILEQRVHRAHKADISQVLFWPAVKFVMELTYKSYQWVENFHGFELSDLADTELQYILFSLSSKAVKQPSQPRPPS